MLKKAIHDEAWTPGTLHKNLLELPWSEVLTTNWDTLLERTSAEIHQPVYSIVNRQEDLSSARTPRIVKLHGTIGVADELIFTQEDFRKYPQSHAAFVNFARQVFIENELCLLGFSGEDPNFLQWAGWVRDHLASHARRIYLVGALRLTTAKRKYLESINVAPIDLSSLVSDYDDPDVKHTEATKIFIESLQKLQPKKSWEWTPTSLHRTTLTNEELNKIHQDHAYAAKRLEEQIATLESDRLAYPGWLTCPPFLRLTLQSQIGDPFPTIKNISEMVPDSRAKLLYEIAWRYQVSYESAPPWMAQKLLAICNPAKPCALTKKQQLEIALLVLKSARWLDELESKSISDAAIEILQNNTKHWPECANELTYHRAIIARDDFDYSTIEGLVDRLDISDAIWKLKKASLLAELGRFSDGQNLIEEANRELLDQYRKDRNSIHALSRLTWVQWLMREIEFRTSKKEFKVLPLDYQEKKCNPWDSIEHIQKRVSEKLDKQRERQSIEPSFEPGSYKDNSKTVTLGSSLHPLLLLEGISQTVGMPLRWSNASFLVNEAAKVAELDDLDDTHRFSLVIRSSHSETSDILKKTFSRIRVACFSDASVSWLLDRCLRAVDYWATQRVYGAKETQSFALDRLRVFIEVLARISVRTMPDQAKKILRKGLELGQISAFQHFWLVDTLENLIGISLESIPKNQQHEVLQEVLSFPLQAETGNKDHPKSWPNPVIEFPGNRKLDAALDRRIDEIIDSIAPCYPKSAPALLRLLPLLKADFLSEIECKKIGEKIWGSAPDYHTLPQTGLLPHALLILPAPDDAAAKNAVRQYLFDAEGARLFNHEFLMSLASVANNKNTERPSAEKAMVYFEKLTSWRGKDSNHDPLGWTEQNDEKTAQLIGEALAYSIVPVLSVDALTQQNFDKLLAFHSGANSPSSVIALSYFASTNDAWSLQVEKIIRQGLQGRDANEVAFAAFALFKWREIKLSPATDRLTSRLVYLLGANLSAGLSSLLWIAGQMYINGYFSDNQIELLVESVPVVFDSALYDSISPSGREAVSISLVRAECAKLAQMLLDKNKNDELLRILDEARNDPLPEVRFAETTDE
jgi:hypothetical protein